MSVRYPGKTRSPSAAGIRAARPIFSRSSDGTPAIAQTPVFPEERRTSRPIETSTAAIRYVCLTSTPAGERPRAKFPARSTPIACSATSFKTNHPTRVWSHLYRLPTSGLRSLPPRRERRCHGRHARSNSRGRASPRRRRRGVARRDGPNLSVPQHAQEAHGCRLLPHRSFGSSSRRQADEGYGSRPTRIGRQADRLRSRSRPPDPFPQLSGPPDRPKKHSITGQPNGRM